MIAAGVACNGVNNCVQMPCVAQGISLRKRANWRAGDSILEWVGGANPDKKALQDLEDGVNGPVISWFNAVDGRTLAGSGDAQACLNIVAGIYAGNDEHVPGVAWAAQMQEVRTMLTLANVWKSTTNNYDFRKTHLIVASAIFGSYQAANTPYQPQHTLADFLNNYLAGQAVRPAVHPVAIPGNFLGRDDDQYNFHRYMTRAFLVDLLTNDHRFAFTSNGAAQMCGPGGNHQHCRFWTGEVAWTEGAADTLTGLLNMPETTQNQKTIKTRLIKEYTSWEFPVVRVRKGNNQKPDLEDQLYFICAEIHDANECAATRNALGNLCKWQAPAGPCFSPDV
jgi:hypothetical protein